MFALFSKATPYRSYQTLKKSPPVQATQFDKPIVASMFFNALRFGADLAMLKMGGVCHEVQQPEKGRRSKERSARNRQGSTAKSGPRRDPAQIRYRRPRKSRNRISRA